MRIRYRRLVFPAAAALPDRRPGVGLWRRRLLIPSVDRSGGG